MCVFMFVTAEDLDLFKLCCSYFMQVSKTLMFMSVQKTLHKLGVTLQRALSSPQGISFTREYYSYHYPQCPKLYYTPKRRACWVLLFPPEIWVQRKKVWKSWSMKKTQICVSRWASTGKNCPRLVESVPLQLFACDL